MKEIAKALTFFIIIFILIPGVMGNIETHYTMEGIVTDIEDNNIVVVEDVTGNIWALEARGFAIGQEVKIIFDNNFTENNREDDIIKNIKKF